MTVDQELSWTVVCYVTYYYGFSILYSYAWSYERWIYKNVRLSDVNVRWDACTANLKHGYYDAEKLCLLYFK